MPKCKPASQKGKPETFNKINKVLKTQDNGKVKQFVDKFKYNSLKDFKPTEKKDATKEGNIRKLKSFVTYSYFTSLDQEDYKLYNSWTLNNTLDIHVCNNINKSSFC